MLDQLQHKSSSTQICNLRVVAGLTDKILKLRIKNKHFSEVKNNPSRSYEHAWELLPYWADSLTRSLQAII